MLLASCAVIQRKKRTSTMWRMARGACLKLSPTALELPLSDTDSVPAVKNDITPVSIWWKFELSSGFTQGQVDNIRHVTRYHVSRKRSFPTRLLCSPRHSMTFNSRNEGWVYRVVYVGAVFYRASP
jgi:hypothetical protein